MIFHLVPWHSQGFSKQQAGFNWHRLLRPATAGGWHWGALQGSSPRVPSWMAHASFARESQDVWGPSSNPSVAASLAGNFHVPQVRGELLPGACHLPLPPKLKLMNVCSLVSQQELSWSGVQVLLPPPEVFQKTSRPLLPLLIPRGPSTRVWPMQWQDSPDQPRAQAGLCFSFPCTCPGKGEVRRVAGHNLFKQAASHTYIKAFPEAEKCSSHGFGSFNVIERKDLGKCRRSSSVNSRVA